MGLFPLSVFCQDIVVSIAPNPLIGRKYDGEKLIIPIEVTLELTTSFLPQTGTRNISMSASLSPSGLPASLTFNKNDFDKITYEVSMRSVAFDSTGTPKKIKVYVVIPAGVNIASNKAMWLRLVLERGQVVMKQINIEPANDKVYSMDEYFDKKKKVKLDSVAKVESTNNILTVSGYVGEGFTKRQVLLERGEVYALKETHWFMGPGYLNSGPFSLVAIPFKIRPRVKATLTKSSTPKDTAFTATAMSGITNLGVNVDVFRKSWDRYFSSGKKATHRIGFGLIVTPGVEELSAPVIKDTSLLGDKKSKQFYVSIGTSAFYSYNGITFFIVPAAIDWAPSSIGKQWIYNGKFWWGFGIGVNPTSIGQLFNKP